MAHTRGGYCLPRCIWAPVLLSQRFFAENMAE
jgi:hypothetical protein